MLKPRLMFVWLCTGYLLLVFKLSFAAEPSPKPILRVEPQTHFAMINRMDVDAAERFVVTAADDKTARVWDAQTGKLLQTLRPPIAEGYEGKLYAIAISPDAEWIAVSGFTGKDGANSHNIYIFQRSTGQLSARIRELPSSINHLVFSSNGQHLAVALGAGRGIRLYASPTWQELAQDKDYAADSYSVDFAQDGRILSTADDGYLRLYDGQLKLSKRYQTQAGKQPFFARFSPDGKQVVVGFNDSTALELLTAHDLKPLRMIQEPALDNGDISSVAWSQDGKRFYAGGRYDNGQGSPLLVWPATQATQPETWPLAQNTVMDIKPLREGGVLVGTADPALMRLDAQGKKRWQQGAGILDFTWKEAEQEFAVSNDAKMINLHYAKSTDADISHAQQIWSVETLSLLATSPASLTTARHTAKGLQIENWQASTTPRLNGQPLPLKSNEVSYSLAIDAQGKNFVLGTQWYIRFFNNQGEKQWQQAVPYAWAVNLSMDNRWVLAALDDGTVRWYEKASGKERLAFYLHPDEKRWVAWTPEGFYAVSGADAESLIGYHLNQGADRAAKWVGVEQLRQVFARADLVSKALDADYAELAAKALAKAGSIEAILAKGLPPILQVAGDLSYQLKHRDFTLKLRAQDQGGGLGRVEYRINGALVGEAQAKPLGARLPTGQQALTRSFTLDDGENILTASIYNKDNQIASEPVTVKVTVDDPVKREPSLYILSMGVTEYLDDSLRLKYAAKDAEAFAAQWKNTGQLFKAVYPKVLPEPEVTLKGIEKAFKELASQVQPQDVFILYLAGHGKTEDGRYYFVPQNMIYENKQSFIKQSLGEERLRQLLATIQASKRWMILDTCYAGQAISSLALADLPQARGMENKAAIDRLMQATGTSVIAAASSQKEAYEGIVEGNTGHGLLTHVLLKGLQGAANTNADGLITVDELQDYARNQMPDISAKHWRNKQFPMMQLNGSDFPVLAVEP